MILSRSQQAAVTRLLDGDPEQLIDKALSALCTGQAEGIAYQVIEAAGVGYYGNFLWWKEKPRMVPQQARAILAQAKNDSMFEEPIPEDDQQAITKAEKVVDMAQEAHDALVRGPEVEGILRMAAEQWSDNGYEAEEAVVDEVQEDAVASKAPEFNTEMFEDEPPWEGYDEDKLAQIYESLPIGLEADEDPESLLMHVEVYEKTHKNRMRILNFVSALREETLLVRKVKEEPQTEGEGTPERAPDSAPPEDDQPGEEGTDRGEEEGEGVGDEPSPEPDAHREPEPEVDEPGEEDRPVEDEAEQAPEDPDYYRELITEAEREINESRLAIPPVVPKEEDYELPFDITALSDRQLQRFHGIYAALAYRANYLLVIEEAKARVCRDAADELFNYLIATADAYDEHGKPKTMTLLEAQINRDQNLKVWRKRQRKHETFASAHKNERDSYNKVVDSLSRLETMRDNEHQRAGR